MTRVASNRAAPIADDTPLDTATHPSTVDQSMLTRLQKAASMPDDDINLSDPDAPLVTDWRGAERGKFFRPIKRLKSFRIDADVLAFFESQGKGYQATVNRVLREAMLRETRARAGSPPSSAKSATATGHRRSG